MKTKYFTDNSKDKLIFIFPPNKSGRAFATERFGTLYYGSIRWYIEDMKKESVIPITYKQARKILGTENLNKALKIVKNLQ